MRFDFRGVQIKIDYSFIFVLSVCAFFGARDILLVFLFSAVHELAHTVTLLVFKGKPQALSFSYYGFALKYDCSLPRLSETLVLAAGPLLNLILYFILKDEINLLLFILNALPVYPLDCGRIIRLYFPLASRYVSVLTLVFLSAFCIYILIFYKSFSLLPAVIYLIFYSVNFD